MPEIDIAKAALEAAKKLNLKVEDEEEEKPGETATDEEESESGEESAEVEETEETDEEVEAEEEEAPPKKGKVKTVPYSRFAEQTRKMRTYERALQMMLDQQSQTPAPKAEVKEEKEEPLKIPTFESTEEAMAWFMKTMEDRQDRKIEKAVRKIVEPISHNAAVERASKDIEKLASENKDFFDYYDKMMEISNRNPGLSAGDVFILAKGKSSDKEKVKKIVKNIKEKTDLKKKARTEKRSSAVDRMEVDTSKFKTVREAALHVAKQMGLDTK